MHQEALFGELRSILQRPASKETWDALCSHLALWGAEALEAVALPYALEHVRCWPVEVERMAPAAWVDAKAEVVAPSLALANALELFAGDRALSVAFLSAMSDAARAGELTSLRLVGASNGDTVAATLASSPMMANLTSLSLGSNKMGEAGARALAATPHRSRLRVLRLAHNVFGDEGAIALASSPNLSDLTSLTLTATRCAAQGAQQAGALAFHAQLDHAGDRPQ